MASKECLEALSQILLLSTSVIPKDELLKELRGLTRKKNGIVKILSRVPSGNIGRLAGELCLIPGRQLNIGQRVEVEAYPASAGLEWSLWAARVFEENDKEEDGWQRPRSTLSRGNKMNPSKKEKDDERWRSVRGRCI